MPTLEFELVVPAPIERVWALYDDPPRGLTALCPPEAQAVVESADMPVQVGSRVVVSTVVPFRGRLKWTARIIEHRPPHAVVFGTEARFVDEQESGPFAFWRHEHEFEAISAASTRLIDRVTYRVGFGPLGWLADRLVVRRKLRAMFAHRHRRTLEIFPTPPNETQGDSAP